MTRLRTFASVLAALCLVAAEPRDGDASSGDGIKPAPLRELLQRKFTQYRLPEDLASEEWNRLSADGAPPCVSLADYNGDGLTDVALLLIQGRPPYRAYHWFVYLFLQDSSGRYPEDGIYRLDEFAYNGDSGRAIQGHALAVHAAGARLAQADKRLGYSYRTNSVALMAKVEGKLVARRIYAFDPERKAIHRTLLDVRTPRDTDRGKEFNLRPDGKTMALPVPLMESLATEHKGLRLPAESERSKGRWRLVSCTNCIPWASVGDFNGDGVEDAVLILVDPDGGARLWKIVAFLQSDNHVFESFELERFGETVAGPRHAKAGQTLSPEAPTDFVLDKFRKGEKLPAGGGDARLDTPYLSTIAETGGAMTAKGGKLWTWTERYRSFLPQSYGAMTD